MSKPTCPLAKSDQAAPRFFSTRFCVSKGGKGTTRICFFQEEAGKSVAVACLDVPEKMGKELGKILLGQAKKAEQGYIR